jgi:hypothetical protein
VDTEHSAIYRKPRYIRLRWLREGFEYYSARSLGVDYKEAASTLLQRVSLSLSLIPNIPLLSNLLWVSLTPNRIVYVSLTLPDCNPSYCPPIASVYYTFYSREKVESKIKFRSQKNFRVQIIDSLLEMGKDATGPRKRQRASTNIDISDIQNIDQHHQVKRQCRRECVACKGQTIIDKPIRRAPLGQLSANQRAPSKRSETIFGCLEYGVALCRKSSCFDNYHRSNSNWGVLY